MPKLDQHRQRPLRRTRQKFLARGDRPVTLPMHSLKLCTVGRPVRVDSRAAGAWQAGVIPFHSFWVFEAVAKPRPYRARVQCHAPRLGTLSYAAHSSSRHSGVAALTGRNCHETMYRCGFHIFPIKPMKMRSLPTEQSHCVHSFKLCIGDAMYISTLRCGAGIRSSPLPTLKFESRQ